MKIYPKLKQLAMDIGRAGVKGGVRRLYQLADVGNSDIWGVHLNNVSCLVRGVVERVLYTSDGVEVPQPIPGSFKRLASYRNAVVARCRSTSEYTTNEFVNTYFGRRRGVYQRAAESLAKRDYETVDASLKFFVKCEKTNFSSKDNPAPRIINPRSPRFNVCLGKYIKPLEHNLFKAITRVWGSPVVFKGMTFDKMAKTILEHWNSFNDPVAIGLDASRFDQSVRRDALEYEHGFYTRCFPGRKLLRRLLDDQLFTSATALATDGFVRYKGEPTRCSGDMNTSLGNCLIMTALVHEFLRERSITGRLCNNGDDCTVILERKDERRFLNDLSGWFLKFGFRMKVDPTVDVVERISFCQMSPVCVGGRWTMVRSIGALTKDLYTSFPVCSPEAYGRFVRTLGECGLSLTSGVPMHQSFYYSMMRSMVGYDVILDHPTFAWQAMFWSRSKHNPVPIEDSTRASFYRAFGIMPSVQIEYEQALDAYTFCYRGWEEVLGNAIPRERVGLFNNLLTHQNYY